MKKIMAVGICIFTICSFMACTNVQNPNYFEEKEDTKQNTTSFYILGEYEGCDETSFHNTENNRKK